MTGVTRKRWQRTLALLDPVERKPRERREIKRLYPTKRQSLANLRKQIRGWIELRGHTIGKPRLAKFRISYAPVKDAETGRLVGGPWTATVETWRRDGQHWLGRFGKAALALDAVKAKYPPRNAAAVIFGKGARKRYEEAEIEKVKATVTENWVEYRNTKLLAGWSPKAHWREGLLGCAAFKASAARLKLTPEELDKQSQYRAAGPKATHCGFCEKRAAA